MNKTELKKQMDAWKRESKALQASSLASLYKETAPEQEERIRKLLRPAQYSEFCAYYFPELCPSTTSSFQANSYRQLYDTNYIVQFRQWFRGAAKSTHASIINPFALKQLSKIKFGLVIGINSERAIMLLSDLQMQLQFNERIIKDFGTQVKYGTWAEGSFETLDGSFFLALGINEKFRGLRRGTNRLDYCVVSDCEDTKTVNNRRIIAERVDKITRDVGPAFGMNSQRIVIDNNYFIKDGLIDGLKKSYTGKIKKISTVNLTEKNGNPSWPARYTKEDVARIHSSFDPFTLKREYYNTPILKGKIFKEEQFIFEKPKGYVSGAVGHWDLSYVAHGDYKAFALAVVRHDKVFIEDIFCRKCELSEAIEWHFDQLIKWNEQGIYPSLTYDATASQEAVFLPIFQDIGKQKGVNALPMPYRLAGMDKYARIEATLTQAFFYKKIIFSKNISHTTDWEHAKHQLLAFEKGSQAHDDFPDALEVAVRQAQLFYAGRTEGTAGMLFAPERKTVF